MSRIRPTRQRATAERTDNRRSPSRASQRRAAERAAGRGRAKSDWVGRDLARVRLSAGRPTRPLAALLLGLLVAGMGLAALRIDILRLRYALADATLREKQLLEDQRVWTAKKESLRDPVRLAGLARERGFERPRVVVELRPLQVATGPRP